MLNFNFRQPFYPSCFPLTTLSLAVQKNSISRTQTHAPSKNFHSKQRKNFFLNRSNHFRMKSINRWKIDWAASCGQLIAATAAHYVNILLRVESFNYVRWRRHFGRNNNNDMSSGDVGRHDTAVTTMRWFKQTVSRAVCLFLISAFYFILNRKNV